MLKSTHKQVQFAPAQDALPDGWTEHKAPTGHTYYYNASTGQSTYQRPVSAPEPVQPGAATHSTEHNYIPLGFDSQQNLQHVDRFSQTSFRGGISGRGNYRGGRDFQDRRRQQADDRPKHKSAIPGYTPWVLVKTKMKRRFVYNPDTNESFWRIPEDLMKGVVELERIERERKERRQRGEPSDDEGEKVLTFDNKNSRHEDSEEYEEVEITEEEDSEDDRTSKKQRTIGDMEDQPVEFDEDDIAYQLKMMGQDYGLDPAEYGNPYEEELEEGAEGIPLTEDDTKALFRDMLDDYGINPYTPWETLIEEGRILQDDRYTVYTNMKARKDAWSDWSKDKMQILKQQREKQAKQDPRIPYLEFLQNHASPKLFWAEFKRKYRKEPEMRDSKLSDKDREKWYREHISRLKLSSSTLKSDLTALLKAAPLSALNRSTQLGALPSSILSDIRYISLPALTRDSLVQTWISTLPPAPETSELNAEESEEASKRRADRERREKALAAREKLVEEQKRRQQKELSYGRGRMREEERELARANQVTKTGLKGHFQDADEDIQAAGGRGVEET
ncbi:hypothetical protein EJ05DRAFT_513241 [Pseudovirgaria hyperparasitica]|uniref:WW domain-containing protein n=1 Tax=Pseudovirgaria hyperparasitica TaxID=470096 RepID=A0A6A6W1G3_9PEZI|nr:uncharacterized protein EJ05DRAFT_513241 [Pseudovirgaria hyperparasitica]KAF2755770.1 hypothetical protein EJ05DRAFT_513241 [Pseudovirgaria hyperparasitica]